MAAPVLTFQDASVPLGEKHQHLMLAAKESHLSADSHCESGSFQPRGMTTST